jgi:hypothetical protein
MSYIGAEPDGMGKAQRWTYTTVGTGTVVSADDAGVPIGYTVGQVSIYLNGVKQVIPTDVIASNGSTITFTSSYASGDVVEVVALSIFSATTVEGADIISTGVTGTTKFLRVDGDGTSSWVVPEGANINSTGETGTSKFLRIDGDGTSSWQTITEYNDVAIRHDILTLALKQAVQEDSTKFNLPSSSVVQFQADADFNLAGSTSITRNASEYISPVSVLTAFTSDSDTSLLLHMDGDVDGTVFTDSSSSPHTITRYSNEDSSPKTSQAIKKLGTASGYMGDGTGAASSHGNFLSIADHADWHFGTSSLTIEAWIYKTSNPQAGNSTFGIFSQAYTDSTDVGGAWHFNILTSGNLTWSTYQKAGSGDTSDDWTIDGGYLSNSTWYHVAAVRDVNTYRLYVNGVQQGTPVTQTSAFTTNNLGGKLYISRRAYTSGYGYLRGYYDEMRISSVCRYPSGTTFFPNMVFSPTGTALGTTNVPSSAVTEVSGVMLLKHAYGANTLGTDVKVYFTANNSAWTEASSYTDAGTFSTGIKMIKLGKTTCTSGSDVRWKVVWANQSQNSKEGHVYGIGLNY